jgi:predicted dehydrogenase
VKEYDFSDHLARPDSIGHFLAAIEGVEPVVCSGEDGREAVRLILASYDSAAAGSPVDIAGFRP